MLNVLLVCQMAVAQAPPQRPGVYERIFHTVQGAPLRYTLSIPEGYQKGLARPLVLALHYGGRVTPFGGFVKALQKAARWIEEQWKNRRDVNPREPRVDRQSPFPESL